MTSQKDSEVDKLKALMFPEHCSSCHSEWDEGYGYGEPCCIKSESNRLDAVYKYFNQEKQAVKAEILEELIYRCKLNGNRLELKTLEELRLK